jgi:hypothetical protein
MTGSKPLSMLGRLRAVLSGRLADLGYQVVEEHPDHLVVHIHGQPHSIYLSNLARALELGARPDGDAPPTQIDDSEVRKAVDEWLTVHLRQIPTRKAIEDNYRTLHDVREQLLPRLIAPAGPSSPGQRWTRCVCEDYLELALVIDQPDIVTFATPDMVAGWGSEQAEAYAMDNLRKLVKPSDFRELKEVGRLRMCATSDSYAASLRNWSAGRTMACCWPCPAGICCSPSRSSRSRCRTWSIWRCWPARASANCPILSAARSSGSAVRTGSESPFALKTAR